MGWDGAGGQGGWGGRKEEQPKPLSAPYLPYIKSA